MSTEGRSASENGDKLFIQAAQPAWPQSKPVLGLQGQGQPLPGLGVGDLLIRIGFQATGQSAAKDV